MSETRRIADELHRSVSGPAWHGPALSELLAAVTARIADAGAAGSTHSIHELVLHIIAWQEIASGAIRGDNVQDTPADWPDSRERDWPATVEHLLTSNQALVHAVAALKEDDLDRTVPGRDYSFYVLLHGVAQHNAYHGGQIAALTKRLQPRTS